MLLLTPVASAFAAGTCAPPSESAPRPPDCALDQRAYDESIARVVLAGPGVRGARGAAPTISCHGSTRRSCGGGAQNLTPTTLELAGSTPVVGSGRTTACRRVVHGKILNRAVPRAGLRLRRGVGPGRAAWGRSSGRSPTFLMVFWGAATASSSRPLMDGAGLVAKLKAGCRVAVPRRCRRRE